MHPVKTTNLSYKGNQPTDFYSYFKHLIIKPQTSTHKINFLIQKKEDREIIGLGKFDLDRDVAIKYLSGDKLLNLYDTFNKTISITTPLKQFDRIHVDIDLDVCEKGGNIAPAISKIVCYLNDVFSIPSYKILICRPRQVDGGVHIRLLDRAIEYKNYKNFIQHLKNKFNQTELNGLTLDVPTNCFLEFCGKSETQCYVYDGNESRNFTPWCFCECEVLEIPEEQHPTKIKNLDVALTTQVKGPLLNYIKSSQHFLNVLKNNPILNFQFYRYLKSYNLITQSIEDFDSIIKRLPLTLEVGCLTSLVYLYLCLSGNKTDFYIESEDRPQNEIWTNKDYVDKILDNMKLNTYSCFKQYLAMVIPLKFHKRGHLMWKEGKWHSVTKCQLDYETRLWTQQLIPAMPKKLKINLSDFYGYALNMWETANIESKWTRGLYRTIDRHLFDFISNTIILMSPIEYPGPRTLKFATKELLNNGEFEDVLNNLTHYIQNYKSDPDTTLDWAIYYLSTTFVNAEIIHYVLNILTFMFMGNLSKKILVCVGSGDNGKSTFLTIMEEIFGSYCGILDMKSVSVKSRHSQTSPGLVENSDCVVTVVDEISEIGELCPAVLKLFTSGSRGSVRTIYELPQKCNFKSCLVISGNSLPTILYDEALALRLLLLPFNVQFKQSNFKLNYRKIGLGILHLMLSNLKFCKGNIFQVPDIIERLKIDVTKSWTHVNEFCKTMKIKISFGQKLFFQELEEAVDNYKLLHSRKHIDVPKLLSDFKNCFVKYLKDDHYINVEITKEK